MARQGNILEVSFPLFEFGGPISGPAALHLLDPNRPFRMSFGQWLFVHAEWSSQRVESLPSEDTSESPRFLEVTTDLPDVGPSPSSTIVGKVQPVVDASPPPPAPRGGPSDQDYERQRRRLISLEATVNTLMDKLRSSRNEAQEAIASYEGQEVVISGLMHHLDTAERVLKSTIESKNDGAPSKSFVTSVEHALFNPQGELSAIKSQLKSLQNRFDSDGECHRVYFSSKTEGFSAMPSPCFIPSRRQWSIKLRPPRQWRPSKRYL
jgi:hypothetical protein